MKKILFDFLEFKTISDNNSELHRSIDYVDSLFSEIDVETSRYVKNNKPSIVITSKPKKNPNIMLCGHLDVVPGSYRNAFNPFEKDGKIFGRGAADMKGQVTAMISAFIDLYKKDSNLDIGLMITTDEEIGGFDGVNYLLNQKGYSAGVAFVPDAGINWNICTDEKGILWYEINAIGKNTHASRIWEGENAITKCWKTYRDIRNIFRESWGRLGENSGWKPTVNLAYLNGGDSYNTVPSEASMKLDIRFPKDPNESKVKEIVKNACEKNKVSFELKLYGSLNHTSKHNKYIKLWKVEAEKFGKEVDFERSHGGSDGRFFSNKNIPVLMTTPKKSIIHSDFEWIDLKDLHTFKEVIKNWVIGVHKN